uniref:C2H2-type domain-containing protein n=1 Tax=Astatotilapia calliptera TaxID=8154 RepID=A0AAX7TZ37_ASTCA
FLHIKEEQEEFWKIRHPHPDTPLQSRTDGEASEFEKTEVSEDGDWQEPLSDCGPEADESNSWLNDSTLTESGVKNDVRCNAAKKFLSCSESGEQFVCKQSLQKHQIHTGERPFGCTECGKRFRYQGNLKMHTKVHADEKPFGCDDCGQRFSRKTNLTRHMRVHTGEKPFGCDECGQRFNHKANLKLHIRVHTGEKPFSCEDCGQRFYHKTDLKRHMRIHTEEKPFVCDHCGKPFRYRCNLRRHMSVHSGEKRFVCSVCGNTSKSFG